MCIWKDAKDVVLVKVLIEDVVRHYKWRLVVVYARWMIKKMAQQLVVLSERLANYPEPCLLIGDFNDILLDSDKEGGNMRTTASMRSF